LFPEPILQGDPDYVEDSRITPQGLEVLRSKMALADLTQFEKDPQVSRLGDLFTVELIARYIDHKLRQGER
jgi:hypothetical protein